MGGGVHWAEWIIPVVGANHMAYNALANSTEPEAKLDTPGSKNDLQAKANEEYDDKVAAQEQEAAKRLADLQARQPGTPEDEYYSRQRRMKAAETQGRLGAKRASQYLADEGSLGAAA